jgi:H+/Cl- antiporter ClcA
MSSPESSKSAEPPPSPPDAGLASPASAAADPHDPHDPHAAHHQPDVLSAVRDDLADWRQMLGRVVVLGHAVAAGLAVVAFTRLSEYALAGFLALVAWHAWVPFVLTPCLSAAVVWMMHRYAPGATGSGIPQVMAAVRPQVSERERPLFVSVRLSAWKIVLTVLGLFGGLAIGREGPAVQIAAGVMQHARRWLPERSGISSQGLMVAGGAAGIAAAFNAPLAGVMFAIEELNNKIEQRSSGLLVAAIVLAGLVAVSFYGNRTYFGVLHVTHVSLRFLPPAVLVVIASGLLGGFYSRLLHASVAGQGDRFSRWRRQYPVRFAFGCGLAIALLGFVSHGAAFTSGYAYTRHLVEGQHTDTPVLYVTLRVLSTWLATWSGVPGGIFAPSLAIGAGVGNDVAQLSGWSADSAALIALGMVGFLAAMTQAPLTAFIIVMEMVDGHAMVLSLMAAALGASLLSRWLSRPVYALLMQLQLRRLPPPEPSPPAPTPPPPEPDAS